MSVNTAGDFFETFCPVCGMRLNYVKEPHYCAPLRDSYSYTISSTPTTEGQILETLKKILQLLEQINKKL